MILTTVFMTILLLSKYYSISQTKFSHWIHTTCLRIFALKTKELNFCLGYSIICLIILGFFRSFDEIVVSVQSNSYYDNRILFCEAVTTLLSNFVSFYCLKMWFCPMISWNMLDVLPLQHLLDILN